MKAIVITLIACLTSVSALAATITCSTGETNTVGTPPKAMKSDDLKKTPVTLADKGGKQYMISVSDLTSDVDGSILSKDNMILSVMTSNKLTSSIVADGNTIIYFDQEINFSIGCKRSQ